MKRALLSTAAAAAGVTGVLVLAPHVSPVAASAATTDTGSSSAGTSTSGSGTSSGSSTGSSSSSARRLVRVSLVRVELGGHHGNR